MAADFGTQLPSNWQEPGNWQIESAHTDQAWRPSLV